MIEIVNNIRLLWLKVFIICFILNRISTSSLIFANKTVKINPINRKNDRYYRYFDQKFDELSTRNSELRHSIVKINHKLNVSLIVSAPNETAGHPIFHNEFTELLSEDNSNEDTPSIETPPKREPPPKKEPIKADCECKCDPNPYNTAERLINEYVLTDDEESDVDIDDNEELEHMQKPFADKYIPMETIELAHQRPQRVTTTAPPPPPTNPLKNAYNSMTTYFSFPKFSTTDYLELGLSLAVTGILGMLGMSPLNPYQPFLRRLANLNQRNYGFYSNRFNSRQFNDTEDPISLIYNWIQSLN